jgi:hypothetical protein
VLANDTAAEGDALTAVLADQRVNGAVTLGSDGRSATDHDRSIEEELHVDAAARVCRVALIADV